MSAELEAAIQRLNALHRELHELHRQIGALQALEKRIAEQAEPELPPSTVH